MQALLKQKIATAIGVKPEEVSISVPEVAEFGHYSTNIAMRLAKEAKKAPLVLAEEFAAKLQASCSDVFAKVEAVKPGFINLWLADAFLQQEFAKGVVAPELGGGRTVVIDYAAPNIAKPMHVGHLRSTIIGDALANIYEYVGYKAVRWNYLGDWGTQFGKLITAYKLWGKKEDVERDPIGTMLTLYVRVSEEAKTNPALDEQARAEFKKLEDGDGENRKLWEWFKDESLIEFHKMFKRLGVRFDEEIGEAFYEDALYDVVKELKEKELLVPGDEGTQIVNLDSQKLPVALIQKSDGASLYITRDIATMKHRLSRYKPAKLLYVVANQQALHFEQLFAIAKLLGLSDKTEMKHVKFGMVLGEDGKKFATREGRLIKLEDLLDQAVAGAYAVVAGKNKDLSEAEKRAVAEAVGIGAIKYNDLKQDRNTDIVFNWEAMLDLHGDTAPYLQYTSVRLNAILKKANMEVRTGSFEPGGLEYGLMKKVLDFNDVVVLCAETCYTSHLAKYLFDLAKIANGYYESVRILEDADEARKRARLALIAAVAETLKKGLGLLGITVPERI